jgi:hypothetical protein
MKQNEKPNKYLACIVALCVLAGFAAGCVSNPGGEFRGQSTANVSLAGANYKLIKPSAKGTSSGFRVLGFLPLSNPKYSKAKARLYKSVHEPLAGRAIALANQTEDRSTLYLILFSIPKITLTADVVEFTSKAPGT